MYIYYSLQGLHVRTVNPQGLEDPQKNTSGKERVYLRVAPNAHHQDGGLVLNSSSSFSVACKLRSM